MMRMAGYAKWPELLAKMTDQELEATAQHHLWLHNLAPDLAIHRLDEILAEATRRGKPSIIDRAQRQPAPSRKPRGAAGRR